MSDPLHEATEEAWIEDLNRFEDHIWPLFRDRGFSRDAAYTLWNLAAIRMELQDVNEKLSERAI